MNLTKLKYFLNVGIWRMGDDIGSKPLQWLLDIVRKLYLAIRFFIERGHSDYATALSFSTMLAIVPVAAVVFAIARGFGLDSLIEQWLRDILESQPQVADTIIGFAKSYLNHAKNGVFIGVGIVFMFYSVLSLVYNVEHVFNEIWQVKNRRSPLRVITDYTALLFLIPIGIIIMSGLNIFIYGITGQLQSFIVLGSLAKFGIRLLPFVMMSVIFIGLFVFMPNTKVKLSKAVVPGILAGVVMQFLQFVYINSQMFLSSYNAIYGSFAALPLFMLWMMISWYICLFCAELCYMNQNMEYYELLIDTKDVSHRTQMTMSMMLMTLICERFAQGKKPYTALELKRITGIPIRIVSDLLYRLCAVNLINQNSGNDYGSDATYQPAQDIASISYEKMTEKLENYPRSSDVRLKLQPERIISSEKWERLRQIRQSSSEQMDELHFH